MHDVSKNSGSDARAEPTVRIPQLRWNYSRRGFPIRSLVLKLEPTWWRPAVGSLTFFFLGLAFFSYPGLQNDEALAASPLFRLTNAMDHVSILGHDVPTMLMAYLGCLKTWVYAIEFRLLAPSYISIRLPALIGGAATVWILFLLIERIHSRQAAWISALVLATDPMFLLTTTFDWGPVALQHLLTVSGMFCLTLFGQRPRGRYLGFGFFCFGLGLWDKALFVWLFGGLVVATVVVYNRSVLRALSLKNLAIASLSFCLGAAPLIAFNVTTGFRTFHSTAGFTTKEMAPKIGVLLSTWDGSSLFGYLAAMNTSANPRQAGTFLERAAFGVHALTGDHRRDGLWLASLASLILLPFLWRTSASSTGAFRTGMFCVIAFAVGWLQMAITREAGAAAHHVVLLWPLPMILIGVVLGQSALGWGTIGRLLAICLATALLASNLLVANQYLYQLARNGSLGSWTDGIYALAQGLAHNKASRIAVLDWGMTVPLDVLDRGRLPLVWSYDLVAQGDTTLLQDRQVLWLSHTDGNEQFAGANAQFSAYARRYGYHKQLVATYYDRNGRAVFQTFRLVPGND